MNIYLKTASTTLYMNWCDYHNKEISSPWEEACEHFRRIVVERDKGFKTLEEKGE
ncbi:MAG: hypothetical protein H3Z50_06350 [archaeon]|nr:hypothetical protein [archaeon]MCP8306718.1 hypothetical protein [archaeon]